VHHLTAGHIVSLFGRVRESLSPGGTLAVMDAFAEPAGGASAAANFLAMFVYLSSGAHVHTPAELCIWLWKAGFTRPPRRIRIPRTPGQVVSGAGVTSSTVGGGMRRRGMGQPGLGSERVRD
jgi:hypothetical protein